MFIRHASAVQKVLLEFARPRSGASIAAVSIFFICIARLAADLTIEQLLEAVKGLRTQKAEVEKKEQAYMKVLTKKANKLKEQIDGLNGVMPSVAPTVHPDKLTFPAPATTRP